MRIAVFASGNGSNFEALMAAEKNGELSSGKIALLVSDNPSCRAIIRAERRGVETCILKARDFKTREEYDKAILKKLGEKNIELVLLAGFMRVFSSSFFTDKYKNKIINIHPSLLPAFKGAHGIRDAYNSGVKVTGVTVHFVEEELDSGPIILQEKVYRENSETLESLEEKIHNVEHKLYPKVARLLVDGKIKINGRKVMIVI